MATTVRCPKCQRKNNVPPGGAGKARCGACGGLLTASRGGAIERAAPPSPFGGGGGGGPGSPFGPGGPPAPASPFGIGGLGGGLGGLGGIGGGDASGARMRQARRTPRATSTGGSSRLGGPARPTSPRAALIQGWDELLHLAPPDMSLTAAMGAGGEGAPSSDPISWLSSMAGIPREELQQVRQVRNNVASNRPVPDHVIASAQQTLDRALAVLGHTRLPE